METIASNLAIVQEKIRMAAERSGRKASDITLVGVTKTIETDRVQRLYDLGVVNLGENKVQELCAKHPDIIGAPVWHLIGRLQTNKVRQIIDKVSLIHSVDSLRLAQEIDKRAAMAGRVMSVLIEVNIAGEYTKAGVTAPDAFKLAEDILKLPHITLKGLMTVAPYVERPQDNRHYFSEMKRMFVDITDKFEHNESMSHLSMGMTNDYEVAIEEGATIVRIGTGIFGPRV